MRPHPHIGLATVTYLFEGAMMQRGLPAHDWEDRRFDAVPGETEYIPLPKRPA